MSVKHIYTSDEKLNWLGYGEWIEEPDEVFFKHHGVDCRIYRVIKVKGEEHFGGHLCGYVKLLDNHPWEKLDDYKIPCEVHGGITYHYQENDGWWIGFDCGHAFDIIPSMKKFYSHDISIAFDLLMRDSTYKNIGFVEHECRKMANQMLDAVPLDIK